MVYLDYAASTPVDPLVMEIYKEVSNQGWAHPASPHHFGRVAKNYLENSRINVANSIGATPAEIIFTSGASESNSLAILGVLNNGKTGEVISSSIEHDSINDITFGSDFIKKEANVTRDGLVSPESILDLISENTRIISIIMASNEFGSIQPISRIAELIRQENNFRKKRSFPQILFHTDATQCPVYLPLNVQELGVDLMTISGQKIYAPKGTSVLYIKKGTGIKPLIAGSQEFGLRGGTQNVPAITAFAKALEICTERRQEDAENTKNLRDKVFNQILSLDWGIIINGWWEDSTPIKFDKRLPNNIHITIPYLDQDYALTYFDLNGICVTSGSACNSGSPTVSRALGAINPNKGAHIRATMGRQTTEEEMAQFINTLKNLKPV